MSARRRRRGTRGQALVEFSLILIPFLYLLLGVTDLGRGIYVYNGVAQAAREIARVTSVHTCDTSAPTCTLGTSPETAGVESTQQSLVPGLGGAGASVTIQCTDIADNPVSNTNCQSDDTNPRFVRVTVTVPFSVITPLLSMVAPTSMSSTTHVQIP